MISESKCVDKNRWVKGILISSFTYSQILTWNDIEVQRRNKWAYLERAESCRESFGDCTREQVRQGDCFVRVKSNELTKCKTAFVFWGVWNWDWIVQNYQIFRDRVEKNIKFPVTFSLIFWDYSHIITPFLYFSFKPSHKPSLLSFKLIASFFLNCCYMHMYASINICIFLSA